MDLGLQGLRANRSALKGQVRLQPVFDGESKKKTTIESTLILLGS
jgi:hypothetical protein